MEKIKKGDTTSIIFYLKSRCGWKETSRQEITGKDGAQIKTEQTPDLSHLSLAELIEVERLLYGGKNTISKAGCK